MNRRAYVTRSSPSLALNASHQTVWHSYFGQFCVDPCDDPFAQAVAQNLPPPRTSPPPSQNAMIFPQKTVKRAPPGHAGEDLLHPPYAIDNAAGSLSDRTASVRVVDNTSVRILISYPTRATRSTPTGSSSMTRVSFYRCNWQQTFSMLRGRQSVRNDDVGRYA
jgi:hypothetical protein